MDNYRANCSNHPAIVNSHDYGGEKSYDDICKMLSGSVTVMMPLHLLIMWLVLLCNK